MASITSDTAVQNDAAALTNGFDVSPELTRDEALAKLDAVGITLPESQLDQLLKTPSLLDKLLATGPTLMASATGGPSVAATGGNPIQDYARNSIQNLVNTITLNPHSQVAALRSSGDSATIAATGQIKAGVGKKDTAIGGVQLGYGVEIRITQQGGPKPGGAAATEPARYVVSAESKLTASGYADAKSPKLGGVQGKASAEGGATYSETQSYAFKTKADAEKGALILQRVYASNTIGTTAASPSLQKSRSVGDPTTPLGHALNVNAVSASEVKFLQDNLTGKSGSTSALGRLALEGKNEGTLKFPVFDKGSTAASGRPGGETKSTRAFTAASSGKPATITFTFTQELSGSDQSKVGAKTQVPGLPGNTSLGVAPSVRSDAGKTVLTTVITHNLTPTQAAEYAKVEGGNSIDDARILGSKVLGQPDSITWSNTKVDRIGGPTPSQDSLGDVKAQYRTYTVSTTVTKPAAGDATLGSKALAAWSGDAAAARAHPDAGTVTKVTTTEFTRHGGEYQVEATAEGKGGGSILPFEVKPNITKKAITDVQTAATSETIGVGKTDVATARPYNFGGKPKAYQDIENQLAGKAPALVTTTAPDGTIKRDVDVVRKVSTGTSIWELARVSNGLNHGHPGVAIANKVNDVLTRHGQLTGGATINSTALAEKLLAGVYSAAHPSERAAIVAELRNDIGLNFGLRDVAAANTSLTRPDAAHFAEPFARPQVRN